MLPRVWARERERERDRERDMTERDAGGVWGGVREWGWGMGVREGRRRRRRRRKVYSELTQGSGRY